MLTAMLVTVRLSGLVNFSSSLSLFSIGTDHAVISLLSSDSSTHSWEWFWRIFIKAFTVSNVKDHSLTCNVFRSIPINRMMYSLTVAWSNRYCNFSLNNWLPYSIVPCTTREPSSSTRDVSGAAREEIGNKLHFADQTPISVEKEGAPAVGGW